MSGKVQGTCHHDRKEVLTSRRDISKGHKGQLDGLPLAKVRIIKKTILTVNGYKTLNKKRIHESRVILKK